MAGLYTRDSARRSLFDTVLYRALSQIASVLGFVVLARSMSKEEFGVFSLLYAFIPVIGTVASFGLEQTLRRYQPEFLRAENGIAANWLVGFVAKARFGTTIVAVVLVLLLWNFLAPLFKLGSYRAEFAVFGCLILMHFQVTILQLSLASRMMHRLSVGSLALLAYVKLVAYAGFAVFDSLTLTNAIIADLLAYAVAYTSLRIHWHRKGIHAKGETSGNLPSKDDKKRMLRYGLFNNFNDAGSFILDSKTDNFFIAAFIDPISVAIYSFYTKIGEMVGRLLPGRFFQNVIQPLFFAIERAAAADRLPRYFSLLLNLNLIFQWPFLAYSAAYHEEIIGTMFGPKYVEHSLLLPLLLSFATINLIAVPSTLVAQYQEKSFTILLSKIFAIYNVAALLVLLPVAGVYGAMIASGSAQFFKNLFIWWFVRRDARWLNLPAVAGSGLLIWGGAVAACYGLKAVLQIPVWIHLLLGLMICALAALLYVRSPALAKSDRDILGSVLGRGREARILRILGVLPPRAG
jgi:O-antigen/teichoic acid export membrane protein